MARTPSKPHVPYRGDDPSVGKKTGVKVPRVERTSDGYEPFQDLLSQANSRTPPRRKKKSIPRGDDEDEQDDDDEEVSMDVDSPVQYATTPRATTSGRPVSRGTSVDFEAVPSPHARNLVGPAGSSRLVKSLTARELLEQDEGEDEDEGGAGDHYADDFGDDDENGDEEEPVEAPTRDKGKGRATEVPSPRSKRALPPVEEEDEEELEEEIARRMVDVEQDASEEEEEIAPPKKKAKPSPAKQAKPKPTNSRKHKENRDVAEGARRSKRVAYPPLEFWRGEKVVFAPREEGRPRQVPYIKEIVRIPKEDPPLRRATSKRKRSQTRAASTPQVVEREVIVEVPVAMDPEEGWDDETNPEAVVVDFRTNEPVKRRVAFTAKMFSPIAAKGRASWFFEKIFGDGDFMAAGLLLIPAKGRKPLKSTKDNTYIFFVVQGAVNVVLGETSVILASGGMFMVPRGNSYFIENIADRDAKIFFTQARKMQDEDEENTSPRGVSVAMGGARTGERSGSSTGR
ncbi:Mif2/CENP-C like-domain-containing protein [Mycena rosella]|uniref:CENP-C homolog n=1 Tax=Mycena rosella TaxID=1033263 RepID=A0AAD7GGB4_MYCRO|nr:Mif2/CENP-C like-domain-containing protein [Mycena rosella]